MRVLQTLGSGHAHESRYSRESGHTLGVERQGSATAMSNEDQAVSQHRRQIHPDNDPSIMDCSRCGCPNTSHEEIRHETERELGNDAFVLEQWDKAIAHYSAAIDMYSVDAKLWSNRSGAYAAKRWYPQALSDAEHACSLKPAWYKVWNRKAVALFGMGRLVDAKHACETGMLCECGEKEKASFEGLLMKIRQEEERRRRTVVTRRKPTGVVRDNAHKWGAQPMKHQQQDVINTSKKGTVSSSNVTQDQNASSLVDAATKDGCGGVEEVGEQGSIPSPSSNDCTVNVKPLSPSFIDIVLEIRTRISRMQEEMHGISQMLDMIENSIQAPCHISESDTRDDPSEIKASYDHPEMKIDNSMKNQIVQNKQDSSEIDERDDTTSVEERNVDAESQQPLQGHVSSQNESIDGKVESVNFLGGDSEEETDSMVSSEEKMEDCWTERVLDARAKLGVSLHDGIPPPPTATRKQEEYPDQSNPRKAFSKLSIDSLSSLFKRSATVEAGKDADQRSGGAPLRQSARDGIYTGEDIIMHEEEYERILKPRKPPRSVHDTSIKAQNDQDVEGNQMPHLGQGTATDAHDSPTSDPPSTSESDLGLFANFDCKMRVENAQRRKKEAEENNEPILDTDEDVLSQQRRTTCTACQACTGFKIIYQTTDALNPDIMFFCSICGCKSEDHAVDVQWAKEQAARKQQEEAEAAARTARTKSWVRSSEAQYKRNRAFELLGVPYGADIKTISKAYKRSILKYHPDKNLGLSDVELEYMKQKYIQVHEAYKLLTSI